MADSDSDGFGPCGPPPLGEVNDRLIQDSLRRRSHLVAVQAHDGRLQCRLPHRISFPEAVDALIARVTNRHRWDYLPQQVWDRCSIDSAIDRIFEQHAPFKKLRFVPLPSPAPEVVPAQTVLKQQSLKAFSKQLSAG